MDNSAFGKRFTFANTGSTNVRATYTATITISAMKPTAMLFWPYVTGSNAYRELLCCKQRGGSNVNLPKK
jgi:hypothetical protein